MTDRILVLGTGDIAAQHARQFLKIPSCELVAAVDVNGERAQRYAAQHGIANTFDSLEQAIAWGRFDAAVNATPDGVHKVTSLKLIAAGKSVFCEKPLALNGPDAFEMTEAAERAGVVNMVNFTYRNAAAIQMARQMVDDGTIGTVRHIEASYLQSWLTASHWGDWRTEERWLWRLSTAHGSNGVLGDIGIHLLDFVTFGTGLEISALQARLTTFDKAEGGRIGAYKLDANDSVVITAEMDNGALASIHMTRFATGSENDLNLAIYGELGGLKVWANSRDSWLETCLGADTATQTWTRHPCPATPRNEQRFAAALVSGRNGQPGFRRAAELQTWLDRCVVSDTQRRMVGVAG